MSFLRIILGGILVIVGIILTVTIIGAIIGIPMFLIGAYLCYTEKKNQSKEAVKEGVQAALKDMDKTKL